MQRKLTVFTLAAALLLNAAGAAAQERERKMVDVAPPQVEVEELFIAQGPGAPPPQVEVEALGNNVIFLATEMSFAGRLVKGAPYSAQAVTESVQTFTDGNRIVRKNTAQVYRDSEGRTRREQTLTHIGPYSTSGDTPQTVFINDPVASVHYVLNPSTRTARKMPRTELRFRTEGGAATVERQKLTQGALQKLDIERSHIERGQVFNVRVPGREVIVTQSGPSAVPPAHGSAPAPPPPAEGPTVEFFRHHAKAESKTEKLEARSFDGVMAEGTRTTTTIPAGQIGNEQPIQIVDERWYSPELQVVVMTRHADPRTGETTYRLTNISRAEPAASLFQVPSDYTVKETPQPGSGVRRMRRPPAPPAPPQEN